MATRFGLSAVRLPRELLDLDAAARAMPQMPVPVLGHGGAGLPRTRVPLLTWFWAIFFLARHKKEISALQLQLDTRIGSYETAWTMLHKLRSALGPRPEDRLTGLVEADESYVGGAERGLRRGRMLVAKTLVAGAVGQRRHSAGRARLAVLEGLTFEHDLGPFVRGVIEGGNSEAEEELLGVAGDETSTNGRISEPRPVGSRSFAMLF